MISDSELIKEIKKGNKPSLELLVQRYYKVVYAYVYRSLLDKSISYDMTQEVFIKVLTNITSYIEKGNFKSWILKIAANQCRDYFRNKEYKTQSLSDPFEESHEPKEILSIPSMIERKKGRNDIIKKLQSLPYEQREVIILRYFEDMKISEISKIIDASESTVKSRLYRGIQKLGDQIERRDFFEEGY